MDAAKLQSHGDRELSEKLRAEPLVVKVNEEIEKEEEKSPKGVRRHLLATSLRLTEAMMPGMHKTVAECRERLGIEIPLELYVYPSATFNAACIKPEAGRLFIMVSSSLLEGFPDDERRFVLGHELAHHLYGHHDIPIGFILNGKRPAPPDLALRLFAWSRYAEISADRAGAYCSNNPDAVARSLFRLASGMSGDLSSINIEGFAEQVDDLQTEQQEPGSKTPQADWFSTHPFSPLRLKAVRHFFDSELFKEDGIKTATLEAHVQALMSLMEPSYLEEKSEGAETARRLLFAAAIAVADAADGISEEEIAAFEKFFGADSFSRKLDIEAIKGTLDARLRDAMEKVSHVRRIQVLRDLCVIARADGDVQEAEYVVVKKVAAELEVPFEIVSETLCGNCDFNTGVHQA
ncbi:MAG: M48 family metallopeptidase [Myxococcota bacterium]